MGAPSWDRRSWDLRNRGVAVLASGVVVAMTALNVGLAPASADPGDGPGSPTTTVAVPEPEAAAPEKPEKSEKSSAAEAAPAAPSKPSAPSTATAPAVEQTPQTQAPQTQAPETQAPQTQAPQTQAPETQASETRAPETQAPKPAPQTQAPKPPTTTATSATPPASATPEPETTKPVPSPALTPATTTAPSPTDIPAASSTKPATPAEKSGETATAATTPTSPATESSTGPDAVDNPSQHETATSSVSQAAREIEPVAPETVEAPVQDVEIAKAAKVVEQPEPVVAEVADVAAIARIIDVPTLNRERRGNDPLHVNDEVRLAGAWDRNVRQWSPDWVQYDDYYRPVFANPYRDPVKIIYMYQNAPRILMIPPLSRIVMEVAQFAAYSFTAVVMNAVNTVANVAVGSFFGGGFFPGIGLPLPPPPPPLLRYDNVPVFVNYSQQRYEPFRVQRIIDVGNDAQYGERKVLLDGVTPAWGQWTQTPAGERQFEVHRTQQFPGLDEPREAPLPGDYQLRLASDESGSSGFSRRDAYLAATAILCAVLSAGAVMLSVAIGRRRNA
jgi:hypothetical protein